MSRWYFTPARKKPPPPRGIKVKKSGSTWWGQRWVEALERMSSGYSSRLTRGRTYARGGRTHDLVVEPGLVEAKVTGSRSTPYRVRISLSQLSASVWDAAIAAMAARAQFSAELLGAQMPRDIDDAFGSAGASLFPTASGDLQTDCTCPDWANPCKHVAATHYVLGEAFDWDPFLLFELRGRTKEQVLEALRSARAGTDGEPTARRAKGRAPADEVPTVSLPDVGAAAYDQPREALPVLHLSFDAPPISGGLIRQLGTPSGWNASASPAEVLAPVIRAAAERARSLAMAERAEDPAPSGPSEPQLQTRSKGTKGASAHPATAGTELPTAKPSRTRAATKPTTAKPKPATTKPKPATTKPKPATAKPKPTTAKPKPTTAKPKPTTAKPKPTTAKPKSTSGKSRATKAASAKPATSKPRSTSGKTRQQSASAQTKPAASKPATKAKRKSTTAKPASTTAKRKSAGGKSTSTSRRARS